MILIMASKVWTMRKCLISNLNSYRPIMTLKYDHGRPGKAKIFNKTASGLVSLELVELDGLVDKKCTKKRFITITKPPRRWSEY
jgi:hypothetical protein